MKEAHTNSSSNKVKSCCKNKLLKVVQITAIVIILIMIGGYIFMKQTQFGNNPTGDRLSRVKNSPNYKNGKFQYAVETSDLGEDTSMYEMFNEFFFNKNKRIRPSSDIPSVKSDLKKLKSDENIIVWLGHSSFFLQVDGKKVLIDPVLSQYASPVKFFNKSYKGSSVYTADDIPNIDYLFISHDHYDHLDYETVTKLKPKIKKIITALGVGSHFEHWGYDNNIIVEEDWGETIVLDEMFEVTLTPSRHRSGRGVKSNQTLWGSFVFKTPNMKIFYSGDTGYGPHFKDIGNTHGPFDLAIMECGQYSKYWKNSHMMPKEVIQASLDLKAKKLMPGHWAKFALSMHDWDEPIIKVIEESKKKNMPLLYPLIGQKLDLKEAVTMEAWWEKIK
ncbi:L-ascorbate metabolism protein UlaG (beta-lactamase superfamily) [Clostridium pascui]|uniref:MBL fold metallo-hydrolase n=1 Tax=Clostridium pascui TaxID=46609 RepID=UPI001956B1F0|nr:MBL fold metallo-hydrolase [Clostridium pascui]MBM7871016.1 L-ascorbate metabolism protein UlaG (beta-lactamase superfamily) [Clostridium pascui]